MFGLIALIGLALLSLVGLFAFVRAANNVAKEDPRKNVKKFQQKEEEAVPVMPAGRRNAVNRMQARQARRRQEEAEARPDEDGSGVSDVENEEEAGPAKTKKELKQDQKRQEREAGLAAEQDRQQKTSSYDDRQKAKQDAKEAVRLAQEEEMRHAEEERIKKEEEEAAQWMGMISVEQQGTGEDDDQGESGGLLSQFVDYIKQRKTVPLEDLANEFKLRTSDVINRVQGLEAMGRITGVMDDRGKFIYISPEEMQAVANYIVSKGRVAISELAAKSNQFIDLEEAKATTVRPIEIDFDTLVVEEEPELKL